MIELARQRRSSHFGLRLVFVGLREQQIAPFGSRIASTIRSRLRRKQEGERAYERILCQHSRPADTGLRFFTFYGHGDGRTWRCGSSSRPCTRGAVPLFNRGEMRRDFTYIDDIVSGIVAC